MATLNTADLNRQGKVFYAANVGATTHSLVATVAPATGNILTNPAGSGVKLILIHLGITFSTAPTTLTNFGVAIGRDNVAVVQGTPIIVNAADGSGAPNYNKARAGSSVTLNSACVAARWAGGSSGTAVTFAMMSDMIEGALVLVPGTYCQPTTLVTFSGMSSWTWAEVPA